MTLHRFSVTMLNGNRKVYERVPDVYGPGDTWGFSLTFNAGVLAILPSSRILENMKKTKTARYPMQQAEQAFLNLYFGAKAARLPYIYNAFIAIKKRSPVVWEELKDELAIVHYTDHKPFLLDSQRRTGSLPQRR
ncbi:hypothetical protein BDN71DRAFT_1449412 [Pleurotus eryngii]|uniref:Uncharacterized protein n=1 Tax=Pleurotus eryngii TaxID=5323 RepID=A0A9P5ZWP5_PLEER|nr:hypothetical protein BDN71DRAFT_1449412 [Pleurotus eryngii]